MSRTDHHRDQGKRWKTDPSGFWEPKSAPREWDLSEEIAMGLDVLFGEEIPDPYPTPNWLPKGAIGYRTKRGRRGVTTGEFTY